MARRRKSSSLTRPSSSRGQGGTATKTKPTRPKLRKLPPWKVLLHNDPVNAMNFVVETIVMLTPLNETDAVQRMLEAHQSGLTLLLTTYHERAELYQQQFASKGLTVTIEAA